MKTNKIFFVLLILSASIGFVYSLIMLTDVTLVDFFRDYLDASIPAMIDKAQQTNQMVFSLNIVSMLSIVPLFAIGVFKKELTLKRQIIYLSIGFILFVVMLVSLLQTNQLYQLVENTDTSWKSTYVSQEDMGYTQPGNNYLLAGVFIYGALTLITLAHTITYSVKAIGSTLKKKQEVKTL